MINLIIDNRERELIELAKDKIQFESKSLDIGDILFTDENNDIMLLIERKTVNDLKASICDGRAREQKARMLNCGIDPFRIIYLVEGNLNKPLNSKISNMAVSTLVGSIINTQLRDNIKVYKTSSLQETFFYIERLFEKLNNEIDVFFKNQTMTDIEYSNTLKTKKKNNLTPSVWFISQLSLIPQITEKIAFEILKTYPTVASLVLAYQAKEDENARKKMLSDIIIPIKNEKYKRLGDKNSEKIYDIIYGNLS